MPRRSTVARGAAAARRPVPAAVVLAALLAVTSCGAAADRPATITLGTYWDGTAAQGLHLELLRIAEEVGPVRVEMRRFTLQGLADHLSRSGVPGERLDLALVPNDWLGDLAERGVVGELPAPRVVRLQDRVARQAVLAVSAGGRVLAYPLTAEILALVYAPDRFPAPPRTLDEVLASGSDGELPFAVNLGTAYHLAPFVSSYVGFLVDVDGEFVWGDHALRTVVRRLEPAWGTAEGWRACTGGAIESLQLQLFRERKLNAFLAGPWELEAIEDCGRPFAVVPVPAFADAPHPARPLVGYQSVAVIAGSRWADMALEIGERLLEREANARLVRASRRLSVVEAEQPAGSPATQAFARALAEGQFFPATTSWREGFRQVGDRLAHLARRRTPPSAAQVDDALLGDGR